MLHIIRWALHSYWISQLRIVAKWTCWFKVLLFLALHLALRSLKDLTLGSIIILVALSPFPCGPFCSLEGFPSPQEVAGGITESNRNRINKPGSRKPGSMKHRKRKGLLESPSGKKFVKVWGCGEVTRQTRRALRKPEADTEHHRREDLETELKSAAERKHRMLFSLCCFAEFSFYEWPGLLPFPDRLVHCRA